MACGVVADVGGVPGLAGLLGACTGAPVPRPAVCPVVPCRANNGMAVQTGHAIVTTTAATHAARAFTVLAFMISLTPSTDTL